MKSYQQFLNEAKSQKAVVKTHTGEVYAEIGKNNRLLVYKPDGTPLTLSNVTFNMDRPPGTNFYNKYDEEQVVRDEVQKRVVKGNSALADVLTSLTNLDWRRA